MVTLSPTLPSRTRTAVQSALELEVPFFLVAGVAEGDHNTVLHRSRGWKTFEEAHERSALRSLVKSSPVSTSLKQWQ